MEAFPRISFDVQGNPETDVPGMTLRQFYASVAMHALIPIVERRFQRDTTIVNDWEILRAYSFGIADVFLDEPP